LETLEIVLREGAHLHYSRGRAFSQSIDAAWVRSLDANPQSAEALEAFVSRFGRMQDTIAGKLLPRWLRALAETPGSEIETLNRAERLGTLAELLLRKGCAGDGLKRLSWRSNTDGIDPLSKPCAPAKPIDLRRRSPGHARRAAILRALQAIGRPEHAHLPHWREDRNPTNAGIGAAPRRDRPLRPRPPRSSRRRRRF
jgi:hypothetical protein